jgi:hypothetical protein
MWGKTKLIAKTSEFLEGLNISSFLQESLYGKFIKIIKNFNLNEENINIKEKYKIPSICVIGMESTGKSALLENITKCSIFPRSAIICTKLCIHLQLRTALNENEILCSLTFENETIIMNKQDILKKVEFIMNEINCDDVSDKVILINICDFNVPNFDFIDIMGCRMYPENLKEKTFTIAEKYISDKNNIIICVVPATITRLTTYAPIAMIKKHNREKNTILALTMCDRVQTINIYDLIVKRITNETDELNNLKFHACVAIINREHTDHLSLSENDDFEKNWFKQNIINEIPENFNEDSKKLIFKSIGVENLIINLDELYNNVINNEWIPKTLDESMKEIKILQDEYDDIGILPEDMDKDYFYGIVIRCVIEKYLYDFIVSKLSEDYNDNLIFEDINGLNNYEFDEFNENLKENYFDMCENFDEFNKNLKEIYFDMCENFDDKIKNYCYFYAYKNISSIKMILMIYNINKQNIKIGNTINLNLVSDKDYKIYRFINTFKKIIQMIHKKVFDRMNIINKIIYPVIVANYQKSNYKLIFDKNEDEQTEEFILHNTFSNCVHDVLHDIIKNDIIKEMKFEEDEKYIIKREKILEKIENHKKTIMMIDEIKQKNEIKIKCYDCEDDA